LRVVLGFMALILVISGCSANRPDILPISENEVLQISLMGRADRENRNATDSEMKDILKWLNSVEKFAEKNCCPEEPAPESRIIIYLKSKQTLMLYPWENKIAFGSKLLFDQSNLKRLLIDLQN
jgi:hypothetical protein